MTYPNWKALPISERRNLLNRMILSMANGQNRTVTSATVKLAIDKLFGESIERAIRVSSYFFFIEEWPPEIANAYFDADTPETELVEINKALDHFAELYEERLAIQFENTDQPSDKELDLKENAIKPGI